jgi:hypothetical protein
MYCQACQSEKPEGAFYASNKSRCKECIKERASAYRLDNLERVRQYDRMRASQPHRKANNFAQSQSWRQEFPDRRRAQGLVQRALRTGRLKKQPCWVCGADAVAHHPDYSAPLDVVWLCQPHHKQAHALVANDERRDAA